MFPAHIKVCLCFGTSYYMKYFAAYMSFNPSEFERIERVDFLIIPESPIFISNITAQQKLCKFFVTLDRTILNLNPLFRAKQ